MRNHEKFIELTHMEKWILQGKIWHAYATSPTIYEEINTLLKVAEAGGVFQDVLIMPNSFPPAPSTPPAEESSNVDDLPGKLFTKS